MATKSGFVLCVDFDGTLVEHRYPNVGPEAAGAVNCLRSLIALEVRLVLWTMRSGAELEAAIEWFGFRKLPLWGINRNPDQHSWTNSPKAYGHAYVDDAAVGCPLRTDEQGRPVVDWEKVGPLLLDTVAKWREVWLR